jgi:hypothetical protein
VGEQGWVVEKRMFLSGHTRGSVMPNLMAEVAVYLIRKPTQPE